MWNAAIWWVRSVRTTTLFDAGISSSVREKMHTNTFTFGLYFDIEQICAAADMHQHVESETFDGINDVEQHTYLHFKQIINFWLF